MLNVAKTKELIVDFRKTVNTKKPLVINGQAVEQVVEFKFLGTCIQDIRKMHAKDFTFFAPVTKLP